MEALKLTSRTPKLRKSFCRNGLALLATLSWSTGFAQTVDLPPSNMPATNASAPNEASPSPNNVAAQPTNPSKPWIVRDPATGRVFQQQLVPVSVPVTRWEARTVEQTVYEPRIARQVQQIPQTTYIPSTQFVMQPKVAGWWNPFKQPVQTYQYVPVTSWTPQTQQIPNPVTTQQWVPRQQKIVVYQPVQSTETRQQLVQTELPQPQLPQPQLAQNSASAFAAAPNPRQPLFRLPILAQQRVLPWPAASGAYGNAYTATGPSNSYASQNYGIQNPVAQNPAAQSNWQPVGQQPSAVASSTPSYSPPAYPPVNNPQQYAANGLRPVAARNPLVLPPLLPRFPSSPYSAPLQTTTSVGTTASRDTLQSGMQPTVLR